MWPYLYKNCFLPKGNLLLNILPSALRKMCLYKIHYILFKFILPRLLMIVIGLPLTGLIVIRARSDTTRR